MVSKRKSKSKAKSGAATNGTPRKEVADAGDERELVITAPNMQTIIFKIRGTAPLVINRFSEKAKNKMAGAMEAGGVQKAKGKGKRPPRNFEADCKALLQGEARRILR